MSEDIRKISAFEAFTQTAKQTFAEAEEKAKQEAGRPKVERFRIGEDGEYSLRILPLAPSFDSDGNVLPMERKGYEYPLHQLFLAIETPGKKGKTKKITIPVIRTTDAEVGYSVDLIDTYVKIAKEMYGDDQELMELVTGNSYGGGLRWGYQHAMMVLDVSGDKERAKGPMLFQCSHSQYKDIDAAKMRLWKELKADGEQDTCPISWLTDAYPIKIIRSNNNGKTEYTIEIGRKILDVKEEEVDKLMELPRIPEQIYRYTRYQMEATLYFLHQYDEKHDMAVCSEPDFLEAVEKLKGELPADDNSHFDISDASNKGDGNVGKTTIDSLYREYDAIADQGLGEKSEEYQELREKIRQFIEDEQIDVRISRSKNNAQLLEEIQELLDERGNSPQPTSKEPEEKPSTRAPRPKFNLEDNDEREENETPKRSVRTAVREDVKEEEDSETEESVEQEQPVEEPVRRRPRRPLR